MLRNLAFVVGFGSALTAGCKPVANTSATESLDALTTKTAVQNSCSGSFLTPFQLPGDLAARAKAQITYPAAASADVLRAFSAVPTGLSRAIVMLGYEIHFVADAAVECKGISAQGLTQALGCARVTKIATASGDGEKVSLILSAKPADIAHSTLLGVMTLIGKKLGHLSADGGVLVLKDEEDAMMTQFKRDFAVAVIHDASSRGKTLVQIQDLLPRRTKLLAASTTLAERTSIWTEYSRVMPAKAQAAEASIFANGGDSFYCSPATQQALAAWPTARALWTSTMAPDIKALETLGTDAAVAQAPAAGLGLWGRWGGGNGPLRQMFANRVDDTGYAFPLAHGLRRGFDGTGDWYSPPAWGDGRLGWRLRGDGESGSGGESEGDSFEE